MDAKEEREGRWLAYHLGELGGAEGEKVAAELRDSPQKAEAYRRLIAGLTAWAEEPVPYSPLRIEDLALEPVRRDSSDRTGAWLGALRRLLPSPSMGWGLAVAAAALFVLYQAEFTLHIGDSTLNWGAGSAWGDHEQMQSEIALLGAELTQLRRVSQVNEARVREAALQGSLRDLYLEGEIRDTGTRLLNLQRVESRVRYNDFQDFLYMTGFEDVGARRWTSSSTGPLGSEPIFTSDPPKSANDPALTGSREER